MCKLACICLQVDREGGRERERGRGREGERGRERERGREGEREGERVGGRERARAAVMSREASEVAWL